VAVPWVEQSAASGSLAAPCTQNTSAKVRSTWSLVWSWKAALMLVKSRPLPSSLKQESGILKVVFSC